MNAAFGLLLLGLSAFAPTAADLAGAWAGTMTHEGESQPIALEFEPGDEGKVLIKATIPVFHLARAPLGSPKLEIQGNELRLGPFSFTYDASANTLSGVMPAGLVPVYRVPMTLRRVERVDVPVRPEPTAPVAKPVWTYEAGAPLWAGPRVASGLLYAGGEDGRLHALDARTGKRRWSFAAEGRSGPARRFRAATSTSRRTTASSTGSTRPRGQSVARARQRETHREVALRQPEVAVRSLRLRRDGGGRASLSRHPRGKAARPRSGAGRKGVGVRGGRQHPGRARGRLGRVYFGSYDKHVYALDEASGQLVWKYDTKGAVVSTPAVDGGLVVVGTRAYDLLGLDARTGQPAWKQYIWFSWVESSPTISGRRRLRRIVRRGRGPRLRRAHRRAPLEDGRVRLALGTAGRHRHARLRRGREPGGLPRPASRGRLRARSRERERVWHFPGEPPRRARMAFPALQPWGRGSCSRAGSTGASTRSRSSQEQYGECLRELRVDEASGRQHYSHGHVGQARRSDCYRARVRCKDLRLCLGSINCIVMIALTYRG